MTYKGIAISGKAGSGKTTVANALDELFLAQFTASKVLHLATPIYEEAYDLGMDRDPSKKDRGLLQRIGDERTAKDPSYYPRRLIEYLDLHNSALPKAGERRGLVTYAFDNAPVIGIVDDLRKVVEAEYLAQRGFALVRLNVQPWTQENNLRRRDGRYEPSKLYHWTETDLDNYSRFDVVLPNDGELAPQQLAWIIAKVLGMEVSPKHGE